MCEIISSETVIANKKLTHMYAPYARTLLRQIEVCTKKHVDSRFGSLGLQPGTRDIGSNEGGLGLVTSVRKTVKKAPQCCRCIIRQICSKQMLD